MKSKLWIIALAIILSVLLVFVLDFVGLLATGAFSFDGLSETSLSHIPLLKRLRSFNESSPLGLIPLLLFPVVMATMTMTVRRASSRHLSRVLLMLIPAFVAAVLQILLVLRVDSYGHAYRNQREFLNLFLEQLPYLLLSFVGNFFLLSVLVMLIYYPAGVWLDGTGRRR